MKASVEVYSTVGVTLAFSLLSAYQITYAFDLNPFNLTPIGLLFQWDRITKDNEEERLFMAPFYDFQLLTLSTNIE
jgi:hypothetical protein